MDIKPRTDRRYILFIDLRLLKLTLEKSKKQFISTVCCCDTGGERVVLSTVGGKKESERLSLPALSFCLL